MIACLSVPFFVTAVERRHNQSLGPVFNSSTINQEQPGLVIGGQPWEPQDVYAYSQEAAGHGVRPGMSLRLAHFLAPQAQFIPVNQPRYLDASGEIVDLLTSFTHLVEPELFWSQAGVQPKYKLTNLQSGYGPAFGQRLPARYTLDLETLPPPDALDLVKEIGRTIRKQTRLSPAIGLAHNSFVAHIAAVHTQANFARSVNPDQVPPFLSACSIRFLSLEKETNRRLSLLGIRTLGQLVTLPLSSASIRLGLDESSRKALAGLYQMIAGNEDLTLNPAASTSLIPPLQPFQPEKDVCLSKQFDPALTDLQILERILNQAATTIAGHLQDDDLEANTLQLSLQADGEIFQVDGGSGLIQPSAITNHQLCRRHPTANPGQIAASLRELLHQALTARDVSRESKIYHTRHAHDLSGDGPITFEIGLTALTVRVTDLKPAATTQLTLFEPPRSSGKIKEILANLLGKHEPGIFLRAEVCDASHPLPERRYNLDAMEPV